MKRPIKINKIELELRKWCIEQAIRWPWSAPQRYNQGMASVGGGYKDFPSSEPNTIARAQQIYKWINGKE